MRKAGPMTITGARRLRSFDASPGRKLTGYPLAHEWQSQHGALAPGYRLAAALPFVLGGEYKAEAMRAKRDVELADFRASVYSQIKDLPDGAQINIRLD